MKFLNPALLLLLGLVSSAHGQDPFAGALPPIQQQSSHDAWELQDPRYDTPKQAVRRKAAWKAAQRRERLETMKRIGYSPSRPPVSSMPFMSSPAHWVIIPSYVPTTVIYQRQATSTLPGIVR